MSRKFFNRARCVGAICACMGAVSSSLWAGPPKTSASTEKSITQIRAQVADTDRLEKTYRTVERNLEGYSTEGGVLTGWFRGAELMKMTARYFGESGKATEEYYFRDNMPIFLLRTDFSYDGLLSGKVVNKEQTRYYWNQGQLVRVLGDKNRALPVASPAARKKDSEITADAAKLAALLRGPDKNKTDPDPR